jgi:hypothetical protein
MVLEVGLDTLKVTKNGSDLLEISGADDAHATVKIGTGAEAQVVTSALKQLYGLLEGAFNEHVHTVTVTALGAPTLTLRPSTSAPSWNDGAMHSTLVSFPGNP